MRFNDKLGAFSLVEILATVSIIGVLGTIGVAAFNGAANQSRMAREVAAGRNLVAAYQAAAADNNGRYLPGMDSSVSRVWFEPEQRYISMVHVPNRYPYRLAPYFDYKLEGTILVNDSKKQIERVIKGEYGISAFPTFGINYYFVGGAVSRTGSVAYQNECLTHTAGSTSILVFASGGSGEIDGYNILTPPRLQGTNWSNSPWRDNLDPGIFGNVDARYKGKAVCVFLDGSVRMLSIEELRDMRLWSKNAAFDDNPDYTIR